MAAGHAASYMHKLDGLFQPRLQRHADIVVEMMVTCLCYVENKCKSGGLDEQVLEKETKRWIRLKCVKHFTHSLKRGVAHGADDLVLGALWMTESAEQSLRSG